MDSNNLKHDLDLVMSFMLPQRHERYVYLLKNGKRRKITQRLSSEKDLNMAFAQTISPNEQYAGSIERLLSAKGATKTCYVMSESPAIDGREMPLLQALEDVIGFGNGALLLCVPGRLAFYEGERQSNRFILVRPTSATRKP